MALYLYNTVLTPANFTVSNVEFSLGLGATTIVKMTTTGSLTFLGLIVPTGPVDGMVVTFAIQNTANTQTFKHDSVSATDVTHRFYNSALADLTVVGQGAVTYRFDANISGGRWFQISRT